MASWAKNQITKQLAKFAKNLDPNSLSLNFFKGEGELSNLELDEAVLSDLLEFPPWLHLSKVTCNRISTKVPWTSLKSDPIKLVLDNVDVHIVATETAREKAANLPIFTNKTNAKPTKYGFAEKVLDGIYLSINTLNVSFISHGFKASVNISRIIVQSTGPDWRPTKNLRNTRLKDDLLGEVMIFKEIRWSTMRVDADAAYKPESQIMSTPLRLITNNSLVRLTIKKRISDCSMIASKLSIVLDDILWVLTRSQILKLSSFIHYIVNLRNSYLPLSHETALKRAQVENKSPTVSGGLSQNQLFAAYNIQESSIHLSTHRIDLHLCDDSNFTSTVNNSTTSKFDESGAALQISLINIMLDHYPYHVAGTRRPSSTSDEDVAFQRKRWSHQLFNNFQEAEGKQWRAPKNSASMNSLQLPRGHPVMYESYIIVGCKDFQIMQVTTNNTIDPKPVLSSEKKALFLPAEMSAFTIDHTTYYYTGGIDLPVLAPNMFIQVNPIQLRYDPLTCIWLNRFGQSVLTGLEWTKEFMTREPGFTEHINIRIEALMPKVVVPLQSDTRLPHHDERPSSLQIQISQAVISNCRVGEKCTQTDILNDLQDFISSRLYADMSIFPNESDDYVPLANSTWLNDYSINYHQLKNLTRRDKSLYSRLRANDNLPRQIWCLWCDQIWIEFAGVEKACDRPISFVDAFPLRIWVCADIPYCEESQKSSVASCSSDSVEVAEVATENDEPVGNMKLNKMDVIYDISVGRIDPGSNRRIISDQTNISEADSNSFSTSSSPVPRRKNNKESDLLSNKVFHRSVQGLFNRSDSKSKYGDNCVKYTKEDIEDMSVTGLRSSRSESDIYSSPSNEMPTSESRSEHNFVVGNDEYVKGEPPPPYNGDSRRSRNSDNSYASYTSLPPAYDTLSGDPGPIKKTVVNDFTENEEINVKRPTVAILMHTSKNIQVQLDHFQLLFLARLGEDFASMMESIECDNKRYSLERKISVEQWNSSGEIDELTFSINMMISNVIVDLVLSPCIGIDPIQKYSLTERVRYEKEKTENKSDCLALPAVDTLDFLPIINNDESADDGHLSDVSNMMMEQQTEMTEMMISHNISADLSTAALDHQLQANLPCSTNEKKASNDMPDMLDYQYPYEPSSQPVNSMDANELLSSGLPPYELDFSNCNSYTSTLQNYLADKDSSVGRTDASELCGSDSMISDRASLTCSSSRPEPTEFDETLKVVREIGIQVGNSMMNVNLKPKPEDQLISVLRIRVGSIFFGLQAEGKNSVVKLSAGTLNIIELGNIKYGILLDPRGIIGKEKEIEKPQVNMDALTGDGVLKLRMMSGRYAEQRVEGTSESGFADIRVTSLASALLMSTIENLQEFGEDEFVSLSMPFTVDVTHSDISIYDDKPRRYKSAIKMPPMRVIIDEIYLSRGKDGIVKIEERNHRKNSDRSSTVQTDDCYSLSNDTEDCPLIEENINAGVEALVDENRRLLEDFKVVNAKMNGLYSERDALLKVIDKLQEELMFSNRENDDLQNRYRTLSLSRHQGHYV